MARPTAAFGSMDWFVLAAIVALLLLPALPALSAKTSPAAPLALIQSDSGSIGARSDVGVSSHGSPGSDGRASATTLPGHGGAPPGLLAERTPSIVNPVRFYSREPAPMGIADFGVTGGTSGASAYAYSSPSFEGQAIVRSMSVSITGSSSKVTAFELNAVLLLQRSGINYSYWIQNGLHLDAGSHLYSIGGAYVWNFSAPSATLMPGEVVGNASSVLSGDTYYFIPSCAASFPGQCSGLSLPATLQGRIVSSTSGATPYVEFEYNVGAGWVAYDNVAFPRMAGASDAGFRVDGFAPTPISAGLYYDAEWDWVGAGGGSAAVDHGSDIDMSLASWNGHNYQAVPTAWNFGSNTGETSSNVSDLRANGSAPEPSAHLASGPGSLGVLYNLTEVGFLNLTVPVVGPATVVVDGARVRFQGSWANVTLLAGAHSLYLENFTNASDTFAVVPGATTFVNLSDAGRVAFTESGLPGGTLWGVSVGSTSLTTTGASVVAILPNGSYPISYLAVAGFYRVGSDPSALTLPGNSQFKISFAPFLFSVTFSESGLPGSTRWWVDASGTLVEGLGPTLAISAPNGSTAYRVGSTYEYLAAPASGTIHVVGGLSAAVSVDFTYRPTFIVGVISPSDAQVSVGGVEQSLTGGSFNASVFAGTYRLVASATGFVTQSVNVTATVGNVTWANVSLVANSTQPHSPAPVGSSGTTISTETALAVFVGAVIVVAAALLLLRRRR